MKTKTQNNIKYESIKTLLEGRTNGLQPRTNCRKNLKKASFIVEDQEDYMMRVSALIEVCVIALDGKGRFCSKSLSHISREAIVSLVLEMVIQLLPFDQMFCLDRISEILKKDVNTSNDPKEDNNLPL